MDVSGVVGVVGAPMALFHRMVAQLNLRPGARVLVCNGGEGGLLDVVAEASDLAAMEVYVVERSFVAAQTMMGRHAALTVLVGRLDQWTPAALPRLDAALLLPGGAPGEGIAQVQQAHAMLKPHGQLVALCPDGPRQLAVLGPLVDAHGGAWTPVAAPASWAPQRLALVTLRGRESA